MASLPEHADSTPLAPTLKTDDPRFQEFVEIFRDNKHYLLNSIAIWMAQAELAKTDPAYQTHLIDSILERADSIVDRVQQTENKLKQLGGWPE